MFIPQSNFGKQLFLIGLCMICGFIAKGQPDEIVTDRPDQTESAVVVGIGVLQIETGAVFSKRDYFINSYEDFVRTRDYATTLVRFGIHDRIELRLASAYTELHFSGSTQNFVGLQPLTIGTKIALAKENGFWPEIAFLGHLTLPWIGDDIFVPEHIAPDFRFSLSHTLSERFSLGYNLGMEWEGDGGNGSFLYTISLGAALFGPVSGFVELYGDTHGLLSQFDYGFTVLITPDLQFDASHGFDLGGTDNSHFLNAGVSMRFGAE